MRIDRIAGNCQVCGTGGSAIRDYPGTEFDETADCQRGQPLGPTCGDEQFVALVARHQLPLTAFLRTLLRAHADVDDVLQETNLVLWRKRAEYDIERPFATWACRIAQLQVLSLLKSRGQKTHVSLSEQLLEELADASRQQIEQADRRYEELRRCVQKLPASQQSLLRSRYQQNISVADLAQKHGRTPQALAMMLYRMRNLLKECVERALRVEVTG
ncbi:MAG: sigma-70 family RNA polymerase sigma factor [Planctomycetaceae bacterium]